ncbi:MAG: hypothetical protein QF463_02020 [Vicinamibacterales bacterium]|jgi:hypothetical protein|nr:hypothetical protein [Acidobacteriota bacterium]MDP6373695.1 hypothetical protein [Vicinamibacterales bacterium]MDP6607822.1 hypothetical protein [Vicinamibacterales bacterium]HAK55453.1 hypothetical protein [Acidobacteriota bacterium]
MLMRDPRTVAKRSAGLLGIAAAVAFATFTASCGAAGSGGQGGGPGGAAAGEPAGGASGASGIPRVALDGLAGGRRGRGSDGRRNPFRFGAVTRAPVAAPRPSVRPVTPPTRPAIQQVPTSARPAEAVTLKFIGTLDGESVGRVAVLSDDGAVYHGRTGEIVDGRYRIVRIGIESIEVEVVADGRRVTVRVSGS